MDCIDITLVQSHIFWEKPEQNLTYFQQLLSQNQCGQIIVLPEMFTSGFTTHPSPEVIDFAEKALSWMKKIASEKHAAVCGSMIVRENNKLFNRFYWVEPSGGFHFYDKRHLFSMGGEHVMYSRGQNLITVTYLEMKIRPFICYDLRFPVWNRNEFDKKSNSFAYDLLIYVANWPEQRIQHWEKLLQARAVENLAWVCGVNRVGKDEKGIVYCGGTMLVNPMGEIVSKAPDCKEVVLNSTINMKLLRETRNKLPFAEDWDSFIIK
jgi:omega-amidase